MRAVGIVAFLAACGGATMVPPAPPPLRPTPKPIGPPPEPTGTAFSGRVLLDGQPVHYFGITVMKNFASAVWDEPAKVIRNKDGRFRVVVKEPGPWDLLFAGPGFSRRVVSGNTAELDKTHDIGDVVVNHGHTIHGVVHDANGVPVVNAEVSLVTTPQVPQGGALDELARANLSAISADDGSYEIDDIGAVPLRFVHPQISAITRDHRVSLPSSVPDGDATIDLTVGAAGVLDVHVAGSVQGRVFVRSIANSRAFVQGKLIGGVYHVEAPAGDYDVVVFAPAHGAPPNPLRVTLAPGPPVSVTIPVTPQPTVAITVRVVAMTCDDIQLFVVGDDTPVASAHCAGSEAIVPFVEPGSYTACTTGTAKPACGGFRVNTTANQKFEIAAKGP